MFDHLIARGQTRFRKMPNHQLIRSSPAMRGFSEEAKKYRKTLVSGEYLVGGANRITEKARCYDRTMIIA